MDITLGYTTALQYWRQTLSVEHTHQKLPYKKKLPIKLAYPALTPESELSNFEKPLHVLTADTAFRRNSPIIKPHIWHRPLPKGSVFNTGKGFYVSSPELLFIQMASKLELVKLIELGYELCGIYAVQNGTLIKRQPLTTIAKIRSFAPKMSGAYGLKKAMRATNYIIERSASPLETILAMLLCLPYKLGGYGLPHPLLNHRIDPTSKNVAPIGKFYVCDLLWPDAFLAVEYDSNMFHTGSDRIAHDSIRRGNLTRSGYTVVSVTWRQLYKVDEIDKLACYFAKCLGKRLRYSEPKFSQARYKLREALLAPLQEKLGIG